MSIQRVETWEYGIQYQWGMSWGGYTGHDGWRVNYTEDNVRSLASGNPIFRRKVVRYIGEEYGEPERLDTGPEVV